MQSIAELRLRHPGLFQVVAIGLVDYNTVGHLHDTPFDPLQLIASSGKLDQEEEIDHRVDSRFRLTYPDSFHKNIVEPSSFAQNYCFTRFASHTS